MKKIYNYGIILASGVGSRYGSLIPKQFVKIAGKTIFEHTIDIFERSNYIDRIIVVVTPEYRTFAENLILKNSYTKLYSLINGGLTRKDSSCIGINSIQDEEANVIIHDSARPFVSERILSDCALALKKHKAIDVAIPSADTLIKVSDGYIEDIPKRSNYMRGQTPQCFKLSLIKKAHLLAKNNDEVTDDCGLITKYKLSDVYVVKGEERNIKITYPEDIYLADKLFQINTISPTFKNNFRSLKDKVIVIFGGTSGIGKCIYDQAKKNKAKTYAFSTRNGCNIANYKDVDLALHSVIKKEEKIDYIVNSAGILKIGKLQDRTLDDITNEINVNYLGAINIIKASIEFLKFSKGSLLLFSSSSYTRGRALYSTYSSTKAAIVNLVQAIAEELFYDNININVVVPERTHTPMRTQAFGNEPIKSLLNPEIVAKKSLNILLSNATGQIFEIRNIS